jgi:hypothetical protein
MATSKNSNRKSSLDRKNSRKGYTADNVTAKSAPRVSRDAIKRNADSRRTGPKADRPVSRSRRLRYYTFQYFRDDKAHEAGSNSFQIVGEDASVRLTLQEARSLYNFLDGQFNVR